MNKEFRNFVIRFVAATVAAAGIFGGVALGMATSASATPTTQAQTQQMHAMRAKTDHGARRQEGPRVPIRESAPPPQRRVAVPGEAPRHREPARRNLSGS